MSISWGRACALLLALGIAWFAPAVYAEAPPAESTPPAERKLPERAEDPRTKGPSRAPEPSPRAAKPRRVKRPPFQPSEKIPADVPSALPADI